MICGLYGISRNLVCSCFAKNTEWKNVDESFETMRGTFAINPSKFVTLAGENNLTKRKRTGLRFCRAHLSSSCGFLYYFWLTRGSCQGTGCWDWPVSSGDKVLTLKMVEAPAAACQGWSKASNPICGRAQLSSSNSGATPDIGKCADVMPFFNWNAMYLSLNTERT